MRGSDDRGTSGIGPEVGRLRLDDPRQVDGYRVRGVLGEGGQGRVYLATDRGGKRLVALKVLLPEVAADPVARERIADQLELTQHLPASAVVRLLAARVDAEPPYLVHEYVPGPSLADRVRREGPLDGIEWERLATATLDALAAIHRSGVVHHDLKPANVLLGPDGPRISDFDLALRTGSRDPMANEDGVMGSAAFLAPERLDAGPAVRASDVFAWAATAAYAATGRSPFHAADQAGVVRAIEHDPPDLTGVDPRAVPVLRACLEKDPLSRPTAEKAADRLAAVLQLPAPGTGSSRSVASTVPTTPAWGTPASPASPASPAWGTPSPPVGSAPGGVPSTKATTAATATTARTATTTKSNGCLSWLALALALVLVPYFVYVVVRPSGSSDDGPGSPDSAPNPGYAPTVAMRTDGDVLRFTPADVSVHRWTGGPLSAVQQVVPLQGATEPPLGAWFSADGTRLATVALRPQTDSVPVPLELVVWDAETGRPIGGSGLPVGDARYVPVMSDAQVALSANGSVVAALAVRDPGSLVPGEVLVRRSDRSQLMLAVRGDDLVPGTLALSADGRWLAYGHARPGDGPGDWPRTSIRVVDLGIRGAPGRDLPEPCAGPVAFASGRRPDQPVVLCRLSDGSLTRWTPAGASAGEPLPTNCGPDVPLAVSPGSDAVACLGARDGGDRALWTASLRSGQQPTYQTINGSPPLGLAWHPSGRTVVVAFPELPFIVWESRTEASPEGSGGSAAAS